MAQKSPAELKPLGWIGSTKKDLLTMPEKVMGTFGYALHLAQTGKKHDQAKPLHGFGSAGVLEIVEDWRGNTYRAVYTVRFAAAVFVLHVFQKKSRSRGATLKLDLEMIRDRFNMAEQIAKES